MFPGGSLARSLTDTLFAHLATRFTASAENIAIEALGFVLARSGAARRALTVLAGASTPGGLPSSLTFLTQAGAEDEARPDIEGYTPDMARACIIECKYWAGLTANQPVTYARRLVAGAPSALVFIVPSARITSLWTELGGRLQAAGYVLGRRRFQSDEMWHTSMAPGHGFVLVSWRHVLRTIADEMERARELDHLDDLRQLAGLCERMDEEAFLPLRSEELTSVEQPRRMLQLAQLAFDIGTALVEMGAADARTPTTKLTVASGPGYYGRYLYASGVTFFLAHDCKSWADHKGSAIWLKLDGMRFPQAAEYLKRMGREGLALAPVTERNLTVAVPIPLRVGAERPQLVEEAAEYAARVIGAWAEDAPASQPMQPTAAAQDTLPPT